jgi:hypothetical protein
MDLPKIASSDRAKTTPDEAQAIVRHLTEAMASRRRCDLAEIGTGFIFSALQIHTGRGFPPER